MSSLAVLLLRMVTGGVAGTGYWPLWYLVLGPLVPGSGWYEGGTETNFPRTRFYVINQMVQHMLCWSWMLKRGNYRAVESQLGHWCDLWDCVLSGVWWLGPQENFS